MNFLVNKYQKQITSGLTPTQVKFSTSLHVLCDTTVAGIIDAYDFMNTFIGCELAKRVWDISCIVFYFSVIQFLQAWECCTTKEWNFSDNFLTSKKDTAINQYLHSHTNLREEIKSQYRTVHGIKAQTPSLEDSYNDTDVPSSVVVQDALSMEVPDNVFKQMCVRQA